MGGKSYITSDPTAETNQIQPHIVISFQYKTTMTEYGDVDKTYYANWTCWIILTNQTEN